MKNIFFKITMNFLVLLLFCLSQVLVFADSDNSSEIEREDENFTYMIAGGTRKDTTHEFMKFLVSVRTRRPTKYFGDNHFCAGIIIGRQKILTAAHCVMDKRKVLTRARHLLVVAGTPNRLHIDSTTRQMGVEKVIAHYNYVMSNTDDIGLIILSQKLVLIADSIQIMPLPTKPPPYGERCIITGWGRMYYKGPLAVTTIVATVTLIPPLICEALTRHIKLDHNMLCTVDPKSLNADPCMGDIGGPLICMGNLTGIISWTIGCGSKSLPSLYTGIYRHLDWIAKNCSSHLPHCTYLSTVFLLLIFVAILS